MPNKYTDCTEVFKISNKTWSDHLHKKWAILYDTLC